MKTIAEVRSQFPDYEDLSDEDLAKALHTKFYSDMDYNTFASKVGLTAAPKQEHGLAASALTGFGDAASFGFLDEAQAGVGAAVEKARGVDQRPFSDIYSERRDEARQASDEMWQQNPKAYGTGAVAGALTGPAMGTVKAGNALTKVLPKVMAKTAARRAVMPGAAAGALGGVGAVDNMENAPAAAAMGAAGGAVLGPMVTKGLQVGGPLVAKTLQKLGMSPEKAAKAIVVPKDLKAIDKFKKLPESVQTDFSNRVASYQQRNPDVAKTGIKATDVVNSIFKQLGTEAELQIQKADLQGKVGEGDKAVLKSLRNRLAGKTTVFSAEDEKIARQIFGDEVWPEIDNAMQLSDMMSENVGSMHEIIGPLSSAMESRLSAGNPLNAGLKKMGLQWISRKFFQPGNPVNQSGLRGDPEASSKIDALRQEVNALSSAKKLAKEAEKEANKKPPKAPKVEPDIFDPASADVPSSYGNPDLVANSRPLPDPRVMDAPAPLRYIPELKAGGKAEGGDPLSQVPTDPVVRDTNLRPRQDFGVAEEPMALPTAPAEADTITPLAQLAAKQKSRLKRLHGSQDAPVVSSEGWRGAVAANVNRDLGVDVTQRDVDMATSAVLRERAKTSTNDFLKEGVGAQLKAGRKVDEDFMAQVQSRLMLNMAQKKAGGEVAPGVTASTGGGGSGAYNAGVRTNVDLFKKGFQFKDTGQAGPGKLEVTDPDGRILGTAADYVTARQMAYQALAARAEQAKAAQSAARAAKKAPSTTPPATPAETPPAAPEAPTEAPVTTLADMLEAQATQEVPAAKPKAPPVDHAARLADRLDKFVSNSEGPGYAITHWSRMQDDALEEVNAILSKSKSKAAVKQAEAVVDRVIKEIGTQQSAGVPKAATTMEQAVSGGFDESSAKHLRTWVDRTATPEEADTLYNQMSALVQENPDLMDRGWPAVRRMVEDTSNPLEDKTAAELAARQAAHEAKKAKKPAAKKAPKGGKKAAEKPAEELKPITKRGAYGEKLVATPHADGHWEVTLDGEWIENASSRKDVHDIFKDYTAD